MKWATSNRVLTGKLLDLSQRQSLTSIAFLSTHEPFSNKCGKVVRFLATKLGCHERMHRRGPGILTEELLDHLQQRTLAVRTSSDAQEQTLSTGAASDRVSDSTLHKPDL